MVGVRDRLLALSYDQSSHLAQTLIDGGDAIPDAVRTRKREQIDKRLARLLPGAISSIGALVCPDGTLLTEDDDIAKELARHWGEVFAEKPIDKDLLRAWLEGISPLELDATDPSWDLLPSSVADAIRFATESSPGPDGIPYKAFKACSLSLDILVAVATALLVQGELTLPDDFNASFLCCLPKKPVSFDARLGDVYSGETTRPLSIVNTDNRLIAGSFRLTLEPIFSSWVSSPQRGFIRGRSMLANVLEVDFHSMRVTVTSRRGALVLFDFKAAFPSVSHEYMWAVLEAIGVPLSWLRAIRRLYVRNDCRVKFRGRVFPGFSSKCGVRQGCPVSPLIFAVVADVLLRRISTEFPLEILRAFADDTAMVVSDFFASAPRIKAIFDDFAAISNLFLNLPKTVVIPLWHCPIEQARLLIHSSCPTWEGVSVLECARYLGFLVGPGSVSGGWAPAIAKYRSRAIKWASLNLGQQYNARVYRIFVFSVLSFLLQLSIPPPEAYEAETWALRLFAKGPCPNWCSNDDLFLLKDALGFPYAFPSLEIVSQAAKMRVSEFELFDFPAHAAWIKTAAMGSNDFTLTHPFSAWFSQSMFKVVDDAVNSATLKGVPKFKVRETILAKTRCSDDVKAKSLKRSFQRVSCDLLLHSPGYADRRLRHKFDRWTFDDPMGHVIRRAQTRLHVIFSLVAPRVAIALFNAYWNRWTTAARFRKVAKCHFCGKANDSIEHIAICPVQTSFASKFLCLPPGHIGSLQRFFGLSNGITREHLSLVAINLYTFYTARNKLYYHRLPSSQINDLLSQIARQSFMRHPASLKVFNDANADRYAPGPGDPFLSRTPLGPSPISPSSNPLLRPHAAKASRGSFSHDRAPRKTTRNTLPPQRAFSRSTTAALLGV